MIGACDRGDPRIKKQRLPNSLRLHFCPRHLFFGDWRVVSGIKDSRERATPPFGKAWILTTQGAPAIDIIHHVNCRKSILLECVPFVRETLLERGIFLDIFDNTVKFLSGYSFNEIKHRNLRIRGGLS
jgi:hypothetical protein